MSQPKAAVTGLSVFMRGLVVDAEIGIYSHEHGRKQPLHIEIEATLTPERVVGISNTLNYEALAAEARRLASDGHIDLVEEFAQELAEACLAHSIIQSVRIRIEKPQALQGAIAGVEVVAERQR